MNDAVEQGNARVSERTGSNDIICEKMKKKTREREKIGELKVTTSPNDRLHQPTDLPEKTNQIRADDKKSNQQPTTGRNQPTNNSNNNNNNTIKTRTQPERGPMAFRTLNGEGDDFNFFFAFVSWLWFFLDKFRTDDAAVVSK